MKQFNETQGGAEHDSEFYLGTALFAVDEQSYIVGSEPVEQSGVGQSERLGKFEMTNYRSGPQTCFAPEAKVYLSQVACILTMIEAKCDNFGIDTFRNIGFTKDQYRQLCDTMKKLEQQYPNSKTRFQLEQRHFATEQKLVESYLTYHETGEALKSNRAGDDELIEFMICDMRSRTEHTNFIKQTTPRIREVDEIKYGVYVLQDSFERLEKIKSASEKQPAELAQFNSFIKAYSIATQWLRDPNKTTPQWHEWLKSAQERIDTIGGKQSWQESEQFSQESYGSPKDLLLAIEKEINSSSEYDKAKQLFIRLQDLIRNSRAELTAEQQCHMSDLQDMLGIEIEEQKSHDLELLAESKQ